MRILLKMQAIARGIITRNKVFKKYDFRAVASKDHVPFFNFIVHEMRKKLPNFKYDE